MKHFLTVIFLFFTIEDAVSQKTNWKTNDGWVFRKTDNTGYKEFFPIAFYGIPGYTLNRLQPNEEMKTYPSNKNMFNDIAAFSNALFIQTGFEKSYMNGMTRIVGSSEIPWNLRKEYWPKKKSIDQGYDAYHFMNTVEKHTGSARFNQVLDKPINQVINSFRADNSDMIWAPIDEVASGIDGWFWPPTVARHIYNRIKKRTGQLVFLNVLGGGQGNSFLYAREHLNLARPAKLVPPYKLINNNPVQEFSLFHLHTDYKGESIWEYKNGKLLVRSLDLTDYEDEWYENIKQTYAAYKHSADIWGFNSYKSFFRHPRLAGITVKAIKAGVGSSAPVWLFFDVNGHARNPSVSAVEYANNVRTQIYISLIHGATGVLLFTSKKEGSGVFKALKPTLRELKEGFALFQENRIDSLLEGDFQYLIVENALGVQTAIMINTSQTRTISIIHDKLPRKLLNPLEVFITKL